MMQQKNDKRVYLLADITPEEKETAKLLAKKDGRSLQGFVGQLIKKAIKEAQENQ